MLQLQRLVGSHLLHRLRTIETVHVVGMAGGLRGQGWDTWWGNGDAVQGVGGGT